MVIVLFDTPGSRSSFYPFTLTRPVCDLRHGILTIKEKWQYRTGLEVFALTESYLQQSLPFDDDYLFIDATIPCTKLFMEAVLALKTGDGLRANNEPIAFRRKAKPAYPLETPGSESFGECNAEGRLQYPWQLFQTNETAIRNDIYLLTANRVSAPVHDSNMVFGKENLFVEAGVEMRACVINSETGPVYIGKDATVMEGTTIRGPVAICDHASVKMGAKLYGGTTIGPYCTAGGEIKNSIMMAYSNKGHEGYLGDSIIGEWCNLGAGTSNSNVKNTAGPVIMWNQSFEQQKGIAGKKAGLLMGDYSRSAINTSFNTGTVVGVCCNVFQDGFPPKHLTSFSWGSSRYELEKAFKDIERWKQMKGKSLETAEKEILKTIYTNHNQNLTQKNEG